MTYIPDADLTAPPLCPECGLETVWSGFDYECPQVLSMFDYEYVLLDETNEDACEEE